MKKRLEEFKSEIESLSRVIRDSQQNELKMDWLFEWVEYLLKGGDRPKRPHG